MPKITNPESLLNIKRIDSKRWYKRQTHGYQVWFKRGEKEWSKLFSDSKYGSRVAAREAAIAYRDALLPTLPRSQHELGFVNACRSNTGHVGITYTHDRRLTVPNKPCFTVTVFPRKGQVMNHKIPIDKGKYKEALQEAIAWRDQRLEQRRLRIESQYNRTPSRKRK